MWRSERPVSGRKRRVERDVLKYFTSSHERVVKLIGYASITNLIGACTPPFSPGFPPVSLREMSAVSAQNRMCRLEPASRRGLAVSMLTCARDRPETRSHRRCGLAAALAPGDRRIWSAHHDASELRLLRASFCCLFGGRRDLGAHAEHRFRVVANDADDSL